MDPLILQNILTIREQISDRVTLIAVTKQVAPDHIVQAVDAGITHIGENRVQDALQKWELLKHLPLTWHMLGHLQKNKVGKVLGIFDWIHSVDSLELAETIDRKAKQLGKRQKVLLQIKIVEDESKFGFFEDQIYPILSKLNALENLNIRGLMTIAPFEADDDLLRRVFGGLRELSQKIASQNLSNIVMEHLSMGMSGDYKLAIKEGATMIRLGQKIFGSRQQS